MDAGPAGPRWVGRGVTGARRTVVWVVGWADQGGRWRAALLCGAALLAVLLPALTFAYAAGALHPAGRTTSSHRASSSVSTARGASSPSSPSSSPTANPSLPGGYRDTRLNFSLHLPAGWTATPEPGVHTWQGNTDERIGVVVLHDPAHAADRLELAVTQGPTMPAAFGRLGKPDTRIGPYPAVSYSATSDDGSPPCVIRIFLAHDDYVVGRACGGGMASHVTAFMAVLASYTPDVRASGAAGTSRTTASSPRALSLSAMTTVPQPESCAQLVATATSRPADTSNWGRELASASDPRWNPYPTPGASVCSNFYKNSSGRLVSFSGPTFQCVELANRFIREQWGHGSVDGNAAQWFNYYFDGVRHDGYAQLYPDAQLSDDASQGTSAFAPGPGDILVWQDVQDGAHWSSGLRHATGHVAVITGTDAGHVYFMQQNYSERTYYMSLPLAHVANGWQITDHASGVPGRIVRGWIHFSENGGPAAGTSGTPTTPTTPTSVPTAMTSRQAIYTLGTDGQLYGYAWTPGAGWSSAQRVTLAGRSGGPSLAGVPSLNLYTLYGQPYQSVFATGADGHLYEYWRAGSAGSGAWSLNDLSRMTPLPAGVSVVGSPSALTYTLPGDARERHAVYVAGSDGNLYRFTWTQGGNWGTPTAVGSAGSSIGNASTISGLSAITWVQGSTRYEALYAVRGGRLYEYLSNDSATWQQTDLTGIAQLASGTTLAGIPTTDASVASGDQSARRLVAAIGTDGHLYRWLYTPATDGSAGSWSAQDVSQAAAQATSGEIAAHLSGSPALVPASGQAGSQPSDALVAIGNDGYLYDFAQDSSGWHATDLSAAASQPAGVQLTGSPAAIGSQLPADAAARTGVYAVTQSGALAEFSGVPSSAGGGAETPTWSYAEHPAPDGVSLSGGSAIAASAV